jgi:hypothetical protein
MNYTVIWLHKLIDQVAAFYVEAREQGGDTAAITQAFAQIDSLLETNPTTCGESRDNQERVLIVSPLSVHFEIHEDERSVVVTTVRYSPHQ